MRYYKTCTDCGAHLDPGEVCECEKIKIAPGAATPEGNQEKKTTTTILVDPEGSCQG